MLPLAVKLDGSWLFDRGGELWPTGSKPNLLQSTFPLPFSVISSILLKLHPSKAQAWKNSEDLAGPLKEKASLRMWRKSLEHPPQNIFHNTSVAVKYEYSCTDSCPLLTANHVLSIATANLCKKSALFFLFFLRLPIISAKSLIDASGKLENVRVEISYCSGQKYGEIICPFKP